MQIAIYYHFIYLLIISIATLSIRKSYEIRNEANSFSYPQSNSIFMLLTFMILFIGFRPEHPIFGDMMVYVQTYHILYEGTAFEMDWSTDNVIFDNLIALSGALRIGMTPFFVLCAIVYFGCSFIGIKRLCPNHVLPVYLVWLAAFSTFSYATNGVKAGCASSVFIFVLSYHKQLRICLPLMIVSIGFHHSMKVPCMAFALTLFYKNPKWYFYGWVFCLVMSVLHVSFFQTLFASYSDERAGGYLIGGGNDDILQAKAGFRPDFIAYSVMPVWVGYQLVMKRKEQISETYRTLLYYYLVTNGVWMLCMYAEFTNRVAYLSWFLYPIVLVYPFLYENWGDNQYRMFAKAMGYHLAFTVFMDMVYYGGFIKLFT